MALQAAPANGGTLGLACREARKALQVAVEGRTS